MCNYMTSFKVKLPSRPNGGRVKFDLIKPKTNIYKYQSIRYDYPIKWAILGTDLSAYPYDILASCESKVMQRFNALSYEKYGTVDTVNAAMTKLSAELGSGIASVLVSWFERQKTVAMLLKAAKLLRSPVVTAREILKISRRDMSDPLQRKKTLDLAGNMWLEGRYGWRPLFYDIMSQIEAASTTPQPRSTARSSLPLDPVNDTISLIKNGLLFSGNLGHYVDSAPVLSGRWRFGQTADFNLSSDASGMLRQLGATDALGTVWDLVPYSFVADWFINLGDSLQAIQAYALIDERVGWGTFTGTYTADVQSIGYGTSWFNTGENRTYTINLLDGSLFDFSYSEICEFKTRWPASSFMPVLNVGVNLNLLKIIDSAALLRNLIKGR